MGERHAAKETASPVSPASRPELIFVRYSDAKAPSKCIKPALCHSESAVLWRMKNLLFLEAKQTLRPPKNGGLRVTRLSTGLRSSNF